MMPRSIIFRIFIASFCLALFACKIFKKNKTSLPKSVNKPSKKLTKEDSINVQLNKIKDSILKKTNDSLNAIKAQKDSINQREKDSLILKKIKDSIYLQRDSLHFEIEDSTNSLLDEIVNYSANDSAVLEVAKNDISLYKDAVSKYKDMESKGFKISMNQDTKNITLYPKNDSFGNIKSKDKTKFVLGGTDYLSDTVIFNFATKKGLTKNSFTTQGDLFVWSKSSKKVDDSDIFAEEARFTTCALDHPHFAFRSSKAKFRKAKVGVTNALFPEVEGIRLPFPIAPFSIFPVSTGERDGILPPQFVQTNDRGMGLINGGYYMKFSDYADARFGADIYTYGSWGFNSMSNYLKRYRFRGGLNFTYQRTYTGVPGDTTRGDNKLYNLSWNHSADAKAMPNASFSTNINLQSSKYNILQVTNNPNLNFQNQISSSIAFSQRFKKAPIMFSLSGSHSQNSQSKQISVSLPNINFSLLNLTPLEHLGKGNKWYKKLTFKYDIQARGETFFYDSLANPLWKENFKWGAKHSPSMTFALPALGPFTITPGYSYSETWADRKTTIQYNNDTKKNDTSIEKGLYRYYDVNYNVSLNTNIFGTLLFKSKSPLRGIRHVIRPNISFSYKPNVNGQNFYDYVDASKRISRRNYYEGALYGTFSEQKFMGLNFGLSSSLEIKVASKKDSASGGTKKISLIDNFSINGSYNLTADTLNVKPLSQLQIAMSTNIAKKLNFNASGTFDPYATDTLGIAINKKYAWQQSNFTLGRLTNFNISISTNFTGKTYTTKKAIRSLSQQENFYENFLYNDTSKTSNFINNFRSWNLDIRYNVSYTNVFDKSTQSFYYVVGGHSISISGNIALTENWKLGYNSNITLFDFRPDIFDKMKINSLALTLNRDLHCWEISSNIVLLGPVKSVSFVLRPKSGMLRDVKVEKNRYYRD